MQASTGSQSHAFQLGKRYDAASTTTMSRASWDEYFMSIALQVATRATCDRKHVGAIIVRDRFILSTGYNGSIPGLGHCDNIGHLMEDGHCVRTIHAEANAICQSARNGARVGGATLYVTASPCFSCFKLCASAGIVAIVYGEFYRDQRVFDFAKEAGIELRHVDVMQVNTAMQEEQ